jgi:hypothetical protein
VLMACSFDQSKTEPRAEQTILILAIVECCHLSRLSCSYPNAYADDISKKSKQSSRRVISRSHGERSCGNRGQPHLSSCLLNVDNNWRSTKFLFTNAPTKSSSDVHNGTFFFGDKSRRGTNLEQIIRVILFCSEGLHFASNLLLFEIGNRRNHGSSCS